MQIWVVLNSIARLSARRPQPLPMKVGIPDPDPLAKMLN